MNEAPPDLARSDTADHAAAAPVRRVGWGFVLAYALAYAGTWLALLTPVLVTIALRVRSLSPADDVKNVSLVLGVGALFALLGNPLFGMLSDRTTCSFGMRRPWLLGGALCGAAALLVIAVADSIAIVLVGWCLAQLGFNAVLAAIVALLPDQAPAEQRGAVAGVLGVCMPVGQVGGALLVHAVSDSTILMFMAPAAIGVLSVALLTLVLPDRRRSSESLPRFRLSALAQSYWIDPRAHPDFAWAWLSRFLLVLGTAFLNTYQPLYLIDRLGFSQQQVPALIFQSMLVHATAIILASIVSGRLSDFAQRRKIFVAVGAACYAIGLCVAAGADSYDAFLIAMALTGVGHGVYFAVDLALVTEVLPDSERHAGKDMGILNIANAAPQSVAPALGAMILLLGGDYLWVFSAAGCITALSAAAIWRVRGVR